MTIITVKIPRDTLLQIDFDAFDDEYKAYDKEILKRNEIKRLRSNYKFLINMFNAIAGRDRKTGKFTTEVENVRADKEVSKKDRA